MKLREDEAVEGEKDEEKEVQIEAGNINTALALS